MAGTDQGPTADGLVPTDFTKLHLVGLSVGQGMPTVPPASGAYHIHCAEGHDGAAGERTNVDKPDLGTPTSVDQGDIVTQSESDAVTAPGITWWDRIHILPRSKIDFGNIITQQQAEYEIYSAYRDADVTLSGIVNNAEPGTDLPDEAPPEVVPAQSSMLDSTSTGNDGGSGLGTLVKRVFIAEAEGLPRFDTTVDFSFSSGELVQLLVAGQRVVVVPIVYEENHTEVLAFLTKIIPTVDGHEQRISLRKEPRQLFEVMYRLDGNDRQRLQALLYDWSDSIFGFPLWDEQVALTAAHALGGTTYTISGGDDVDFRVGGLALAFTDANTFDAITITAKSDTQITAADPSTNNYPVGTVIVPLRTAFIRDIVNGARYRNNIEDFRITFEVSDNSTGTLAGDVSAFTSYNGRVLFDDCNVMDQTSFAEQYMRNVHTIDSETGVVAIVSHWDTNKRQAQKGFVMRDRSELITFRKLLASLRGMQTAFYMPSRMDDLEVKAQLTIGTRTLDVEMHGYERHIRARGNKVAIRVNLTSGATLERTIVSAANVDATTERLTFDAGEAAWPATYAVADIERVEFLELSRFNTDTFRIQHPRVGLTKCSAPTIEVFDDN